jgi:hypothetical protein
MKDSHLKTPRTLNECHWTPGYESIPSDKEPLWEVIAGYVLAVVIGVALAAALFYGLSS